MAVFEETKVEFSENWLMIGVSQGKATRIDKFIQNPNSQPESCQDAFDFCSLGGTLAFAIADGVGSELNSHLGAKTAVETAIQTASEAFSRPGFGDDIDAQALCRGILDTVHRQLCATASINNMPLRSLACTTIVGLIEKGARRLTCAMVGDGFVIAKGGDDAWWFPQGQTFQPNGGVYPITDPRYRDVVQIETRAMPQLDTALVFTDGLEHVFFTVDRRPGSEPARRAPYSQAIAAIKEAVLDGRNLSRGHHIARLLGSRQDEKLMADDRTLIVLQKLANWDDMTTVSEHLRPEAKAPARTVATVGETNRAASAEPSPDERPHSEKATTAAPIQGVGSISPAGGGQAPPERKPSPSFERPAYLGAGIAVGAVAALVASHFISSSVTVGRSESPPSTPTQMTATASREQSGADADPTKTAKDASQASVSDPQGGKPANSSARSDERASSDRPRAANFNPQSTPNSAREAKSEESGPRSERSNAEDNPTGHAGDGRSPMPDAKSFSPSSVSSYGSGANRSAVQGNPYNVTSLLQFSAESVELSPEMSRQLEDIAQKLHQNPGAEVLLKEYANVTIEDDPSSLSEKRVQAVVSALKQRGVSDGQIAVHASDGRGPGSAAAPRFLVIIEAGK